MDGETEDLITQEYLEVQNDVNRLRELALDDETSKPLGKGTVTYQDLDFHALIGMRFQHQTRQAAAGVRTKGWWQNENPAETLQKKIIRRFHEILGEEQDDVAVGTGYERKAHWIQAAKGGQSADKAATGNTANAVAAATLNATKVRIVVIYTAYWAKYLENRLQREDTRSFVNSKSLVSILSPPHVSLLSVCLKAETMFWSWLVMS